MLLNEFDAQTPKPNRCSTEVSSDDLESGKVKDIQGSLLAIAVSLPRHVGKRFGGGMPDVTIVTPSHTNHVSTSRLAFPAFKAQIRHRMNFHADANVLKH